MDSALEGHLRQLRSLPAASAHAGALYGLEKESLRVDSTGKLSQHAHPRCLGSALTHPYITTDYSEALLEFITPPQTRAADSLSFLHDVHRYVYECLDEELLWAASMPCRVSSDADVPIAQYGSSNVGRMKSIYRVGLGHRYGRTMQTISGVHFNYSFPPRLLQLAAGGATDPASISAAYFGVLRNFRRWGWLVLFLFGASPALCKSFPIRDDAELDDLDDGTWYLPHATSLRMSDVGYKNKVQAQLEIPVNSIDEYISGLTHAIRTPWPDYERLGVKRDGEYQQLNTNILQIENEYYGLMRPKRVAHSGETPTHALRRAGVEYLEMRALDLDPLQPMGVGASQLAFLEGLMLLCLLSESPPIDAAEQRAIDHNAALVARRGREPGLALEDGQRSRLLTEWGGDLCRSIHSLCVWLDGGNDRGPHSRAAEDCARTMQEPERTPSARIIAEICEREESFSSFGLRMSRRHRDAIMSAPPPSPARSAFLSEACRDSVQRQQEIEAADELTLDEYLQRYFAQSAAEADPD